MPEMLVKQDAVRGQNTLKKVEEELQSDQKQAGAAQRQQSYVRDEQAKAAARKEAEAAGVRKKLQQNDKTVAGLEKTKADLEKRQKADAKLASSKLAEADKARPARDKEDARKSEAAQKKEAAANAEAKKQAEVEQARAPDREKVKDAVEKRESAEEEEGAAEEAEHEAAAEESGGSKAKAQAEAKAGAPKAVAPKKDGHAEALKTVRASLRKAYSERRALTLQLSSILNGLAGLETNAEKRKKISAEARQKLPLQVIALERKERALR